MSDSYSTLSIRKDQISSLPIATFNGEIFVVDTEEQAAEAVEYLKAFPVIGFDTETKPSFKKGTPNKMALMQLSTDDRCYLFRLCRLGIPEALAQLIQNPDVLKIGLSVHDDFHVMHRSVSIEPRGFIDLQNMAKDYNIADISLQKIYAILFSQKISKSQRLTNWEAPALTKSQQMYAAIDAWACLKIFNYLKSGQFNPAESPYKITAPRLNENT